MIKHMTNKNKVDAFISDCILKNIEFTIDGVIEKTKVFCELHNIEFDEDYIRSSINNTITVLKNKNLIEQSDDTYIVMYEAFGNDEPSTQTSTLSYTMNDHYHY